MSCFKVETGKSNDKTIVSLTEEIETLRAQTDDMKLKFESRIQELQNQISNTKVETASVSNNKLTSNVTNL